MQTKTVLALAVVTLALGACKHTMPLGSDFGNAVNQNHALHVVDPQPAGAGAGAPDLDGTRAIGGFERYVTDSVETPVAEGTGE